MKNILKCHLLKFLSSMQSVVTLSASEEYMFLWDIFRGSVLPSEQS